MRCLGQCFYQFFDKNILTKTTIIFTISKCSLPGQVIKTLTKGIISLEPYRSYNQTNHNLSCATDSSCNYLTTSTLSGEYMLYVGQLAIITGGALWQLFATYMKWPVSGTHSIVGALMGFSIISTRSFGNIKWVTIGEIALGWVISPVLSGLFTVLVYTPLRNFIVMAENPMKYGLVILPFLWGILVFINIGTVLTTGEFFTSMMGVDNTAIMWYFAGICGCFIAVGVLAGLLTGQNVYTGQVVRFDQSRGRPLRGIVLKFMEKYEFKWRLF